ncbi:hypothetical protein B0H16DRAFT_1750358 [Mycena metata]|uniref:Uncharacterized protein n=1 Tax=Mycena metata TaxID=1033252 RepID=A0AAD7DPX6_9AGAR|nr:hypothetical protein B0H16DRAFT_1750358 [Mycena metata]
MQKTLCCRLSSSLVGIWRHSRLLCGPGNEKSLSRSPIRNAGTSLSWPGPPRFFAKYCPHLIKLSIAFDATTIPTAQGDLSLESLKSLNVESSPIAAARPVARFIARIFPSLTDITTLIDSLDKDPEWEADVGPQVLQYDQYWKDVAAICTPIQ